MSAEKVAAIREENNSTTADRLITDESVAAPPVPNPVEKFEQCFSEYEDLLGEINIVLNTISFHQASIYLCSTTT